MDRRECEDLDRHITKIDSWNDLVYALAKRSKELANMKMAELRETGGYNCDTPNQAREMHRHSNRGEMVEYNIVEEFIKEFDKHFAEE